MIITIKEEINSSKGVKQLLQFWFLAAFFAMASISSF